MGGILLGVEIVGRACRLPGANNVEEFWGLLSAQRCSVTSVPEERFAQSWYLNKRRSELGKAYTFAAGVISDIWGFDPNVFSITPREARQMDPQQRLVLQLVWEALEDAGVPASTLSRRNIGVYMGASSMDHSHRQYFDPAGTDSYLMTGNTLSLIANRVSYQFDLRGPSLTIDTACSSSLVALDYAVQDLRAGKIDAAIVGGVNGLLSPFNFMGFCAASMLSPDGLCRAFDHRANGYVRSEGGVVMMLQRSGGEFARRSVHGEVLACAMNSDGRTSGVALPSSDQQAELLHTLYADAAIDPRRLAFIEAHGTGTPVGDPVECYALGKVLGVARRAPLPIGSAKSNIGHLEPASGMVGLLKAQLALERGVLPATLHVERPNPHIPFDDLNLKVALEPVTLSHLPASRRLAGVNNFGFGGTNVHVIVGPAKPRRKKATAAPRRGTAHAPSERGQDGTLLLLTAQCHDSLVALAGRYVEALDDPGGVPESVQPAALANACAHYRDLLAERLVIAADRRCDLKDALHGFIDGLQRPNVHNGTAVARSAKTAFVFSGNGAQWSGMGRTALKRSASFRRHFQEVRSAYQDAAGIDLEELIWREDLADRLSRTETAQPLLFAIQIALAKALMAQGVTPAALVGHSVGEVAAACISGALDLDQAVSVIRARSHHQEIARGCGRMAALQVSDADAQLLIARTGLQHVEVAAINSPRSVTVAGDRDGIRHLLRAAVEQRIAAKLLDMQYPFHSARLDPARVPIERALSALRPCTSAIPLYSTVTGGIVEGTELGATYWWKNVREPVRFRDAITAAAGDGCQVFVEVGPRPILRTYIADSVAELDHDARVVSTFDPPDDGSVDPVRAALGRTIVAGARFNADAAFGPLAPSSIVLPHYPWQNKIFRLTPSPEALGTFSSSHVHHPLLGVRLRGEDMEWCRQLDTTVVPYLADHKVGGKAIMPGTCYVEMALAAAAQQLKCERVELRDVDFVQALELSAEACQDVSTRLELEASTAIIVSRARLTTDERQTHMRARFARLPSENQPIIPSFERQTSAKAKPLDDVYRLAERFGLQYGPTFQRVTACREIGDDVIEVELSAGDEEAESYVLHPVDFDACLHGLNLIYKRLRFGENRLAYVPVRIGNLRVFKPGVRIGSARIRIGRYSVRGVVADLELFGHDGALVALAKEVRLKAASLVHRLKLDHAAYHVDKVVRALPEDSSRSNGADLAVLCEHLSAAAPILEEDARTSLRENLLLVDLAARRVAYDIASRLADEQGRVDLTSLACLGGNVVGDETEDEDLSISGPLGADAGNARAESLLHVLEDADLARHLGHCWQIEPECPLPPLEEIVANVLADDPGWSAECIILANAAAGMREGLGHHEPAPPHATGATGHSLATFESFQCSAPRARAQIAAVAQAVRAAMSHGQPTRPFRILQLGVSGGGLTRQLLPLLSDGRGRLVVADSDAAKIGRLASRWPAVPGLEIVAIDDELSQLTAFAHFDLVVSIDGLSWLPECDSILSRLPDLLADRAIAIVSEKEPDSFHSVAFGNSSDQPSTGGATVSLRDAAAWRQALALAGFTDVQDAGEALTVPGTCLLLAQRTHVPSENSGLVDARAMHDPHGRRRDDTAASGGRAVVVVGRGARSRINLEHKLAHALRAIGLCPILSARALLAKGDGAARVNGSKKGNGAAKNGHADDASTSGHARHGLAEAWSAVIRQLDNGKSDQIDIVYTLNAAPATPDGHQRQLLARVRDLTGLLQALGDRTARLWIVAEGGARAVAGLGSPCPVQTGLWSYGRTAINEHGKLDLRLVDFADGMTPDEKAARLALLLSEPGAWRELILTADSVVGLEIRRGIPEPVAAPPAHVCIGSEAAVVLQQNQSGNLDELTWMRSRRRPPGDYEVEIEVAAAALNFRDVMWVLGLLPEEALEDGFAGPTIGLECAGRIARVGPSVAGLAPGDPVIAIAPASFASHVTVASLAVARLPNGVRLREAAAIPVPFLTACYALEHLAHVRRNDWVLIHGAAGGVGLAAIQVAKRNGACIIATAGSHEKRTFLRLLGADQVLDTRSLDFVDQVREITGGGVNVVLNSLAGEAMERSLELLRPFGRFIELGKRDFYAGTKVSLRPFRDNISYFGVDADQLLTHEPDVAQQVLGSVIAGFENGSFSPLPCRVFGSEDIVDAFRLMQKSGHIGKIIVEAPSASGGTSASITEFTAGDHGAHVIFGGTSGFGLEYARWLADRGARHILVASRSGGANGKVGAVADTLRARGIHLESVACDVTDKRAVTALLRQVRKKRPIAGIAHTAMVLDDCLIQSMTPERIEKVLAPKVAGARNLDLLTRDDTLDYFILFSSAAAMFGNPAQASYVAANGYLDGLARQRRELGLKALAVAWGAITDVGVLAREKDTAKSLARHTGGIQFTARDGLDLLAHVLANKQAAEASANITLAAMNWGLAKDVLPIMNSPAYDLIRREAAGRGDGGLGGLDLRAAVQSLDEAAAKRAVADYLIGEVAAIFRMPPEDINPKRSLTDIGMDSLMGLELRMAVEQQIGIDIMKVSMSGGTTINDVAEHIASRLRHGLPGEGEVPAEHASMISQHVADEINEDELWPLGEKIAVRETELQRVV